MASTVRFGKYQLLGKIAQGGMAQILLARAQGVSGFEKLVVVKRILPQYAQDEDFIKMFIDEAKIASSLNHPNICQIYDLGTVGEYYYIAMEYIEGRDIHSIIRYAQKKKNPAHKSHIVYVISEACKGLSYAHNKKGPDGKPLNIVHRDISPSNIIVSYEGDIKIVDFGIARAENKTVNTQVGKIKGKFSYLSPEQANGKEVDKRSDIFALGAVMFEAFTGKRLFDSPDDLGTLKMVQECQLSNLENTEYDFDDELKQILLKALAKNPDERYQDASEMQQDLVRYLNQRYPGFMNAEVAKYMRSLFDKDIERLHAQMAEIRMLAESGDMVEEGPLMDAGLLSGASSSTGSYRTVGTPPSGSYPFPSTPSARPQHSPLFRVLSGVIIALIIALSITIAIIYISSTSRPQIGVLILKSDPPGASVTLDGIAISEPTPTSVSNLLLTQSHQIVFSKEGYDPFKQDILFPSGQTTFEVKAELKRVTATLEITSRPSGAEVHIDGELKGLTPITIENIAPNKLISVEIVEEDYIPYKKDLVLEKGTKQSIAAALEKKPQVAAPASTEETSTPPPKDPGAISISSTPWVNITIDGKPCGTTPLVSYKLPAGKHTVALENPSFGIKEKTTVTIEPSKTFVLKKNFILDLERPSE